MSREAGARTVASLARARSALAGALASRRPEAGVLPFGDIRIDDSLPGGGLPLGCWHEVAGEGLEGEIAAAPGAFVAALLPGMATLTPEGGVVVWAMRRDDLYGPGLCQQGFPARRLIQIKARTDAEVLAAMEDALRAVGVAVVVGEAAAADLTAGRRLQLACERRGATAFLIRRRPFGGKAPERGAGAPVTRWSIASAPSEPATGEPGGGLGLGAPRWRVVLERCRGGRPGAWIMEKADAPHPLRVVARLGDRQLETAPSLRLAG